MSRAESELKRNTRAARSRGRALSGVLLVLAGTTCFAVKSIFIKMAYTEGAGPEETLLLREWTAVPLFWALFFISRRSMPAGNRGDAWRAGTAGLLAFFLSPLLDFLGLRFVSAVMERLLLASSPMFVLMFTALIHRRAISAGDATAVLVTGAGLVLALGGWDASLVRANLGGAALILGSSMFYALYLVMAGRLVHRIGGIRINAWGMTTAAYVMAAYAFVLGAAGRPLRVWGLSPKAYGLIFLLAFVSTFLSFLMMLEGMKRVGAERASIVSMLGPVLTIALGTWVLGERLEPVQWVGCVVVLAAVTTSEIRKIHGKG